MSWHEWRACGLLRTGPLTTGCWRSQTTFHFTWEAIAENCPQKDLLLSAQRLLLSPTTLRLNYFWVTPTIYNQLFTNILDDNLSCGNLTTLHTTASSSGGLLNHIKLWLPNLHMLISSRTPPQIEFNLRSGRGYPYKMNNTFNQFYLWKLRWGPTLSSMAFKSLQVRCDWKSWNVHSLLWVVTVTGHIIVHHFCWDILCPPLYI